MSTVKTKPKRRPIVNASDVGAAARAAQVPAGAKVIDTLRATIEIVTVAMAKEWLGVNVINRKIKGRHTLRLASALTKDEFEINGDTIRFNINGELIDGQNRLMAIIESGVPLQCIVVRGLPLTAQSTIDHGVPRSTADSLHMSGIKHCTRLAGAINKIASYLKRDRHLRQADSWYISDETKIHFVKMWELESFVLSNRTTSQGRGWFPGGVATAVAFLSSFTLGNEDSIKYWSDFITGTDLPANTGRNILRQQLARPNVIPPKGMPIQAFRFYLAVEAFNADVSGRKVKRLQISHTTNPAPRLHGVPEVELLDSLGISDVERQRMDV